MSRSIIRINPLFGSRGPFWTHSHHKIKM